MPTFTDVSLGELWPGIAGALKARGDAVEKTFTVLPGADASRIRVRLRGARALRVEADGALEADPGGGAPLRFTAPVAYQERGGAREAVAVSYQLDGDEYGFRLGPYDPAARRRDRSDPAVHVLRRRRDVRRARPRSPFTRRAGRSTSPDSATRARFPESRAARRRLSAEATTTASSPRYSADLTTLEQATYLGGGAYDIVTGLAIASSGDVYVVGETTSTNFPGTTGGAQASAAGLGDAFVVKLPASLTGTIQSTYLGGASADHGSRSVAVDPGTGKVFVAGWGESKTFPGTTGGGADDLHEQFFELGRPAERGTDGDRAVDVRRGSDAGLLAGVDLGRRLRRRAQRDSAGAHGRRSDRRRRDGRVRDSASQEPDVVHAQHLLRRRGPRLVFRRRGECDLGRRLHHGRHVLAVAAGGFGRRTARPPGADRQLRRAVQRRPDDAARRDVQRRDRRRRGQRHRRGSGDGGRVHRGNDFLGQASRKHGRGAADLRWRKSRRLRGALQRRAVERARRHVPGRRPGRPPTPVRQRGRRGALDPVQRRSGRDLRDRLHVLVGLSEDHGRRPGDARRRPERRRSRRVRDAADAGPARSLRAGADRRGPDGRRHVGRRPGARARGDGRGAAGVEESDHFVRVDLRRGVELHRTGRRDAIRSPTRPRLTAPSLPGRRRAAPACRTASPCPCRRRRRARPRTGTSPSSRRPRRTMRR